ncbi:MAG: signal peptide peptidase SppA [Planctomycetota bacterium]
MEDNLNANITPTKSKRSTSFWLAIIFGVALALSVLLNIILFVMVVSKTFSSAAFSNINSDKRYNEQFVSGNISSNNKILLIQVNGIIMSGSDDGMWGSKIDPVQMIIDSLEKAETDNNIKAIILEINSPGGTVTASDNIHTALKRFKNKRPNVSIVAYLGEVAASGGYYIAMPSNRIVVHPTSVTGSIGVIATVLNVEGLFQKIGLKTEAIKSADKKDMLSSTRTMTKEEQAIIQGIIDELYQRFVDIVVAGRPNLTKEEIFKLADGRIYTGAQAVKNGLADKTGDREDAFESAKQLANISEAKMIQYKKKYNIFQMFDMSAVIQTPNIVSDLKNIILEKNTPKLLYLWEME